MEIKTIKYEDKNLSYFHNPDGTVRLDTSEFFNILGVNSADYIAPGEENYIDYQLALPLAYRIDMEFHQFLKDNFDEFEIGAFSYGK